MDTKEAVLNVLNELTGEDFTDRMDEDLFDTGLMDSMAVVQMLLELQQLIGITPPVSEFVREEWETPTKIVEKVESLRNE